MVTSETAERFIKAADALTAALTLSQPKPELRMINIPTSADEAEAMEKMGFAWLREHAPERLTPEGLARPIPGPAPLPVAVKAILDQVAEMLRVYENEAPHLLNDELANLMALAKGSCSSLSSPVGGMEVEKPHPLASFPDGLKPGLYIIHWKSGGTSQAAIGMQSDGSRWIAPTNWIRPGLVPSAGEWGEIERAELITPASDIAALREENDPPITAPLQKDTDDTWRQVVNLFRRHGLSDPPTGLRDELVIALEWAWFGYDGAKR